MHEIQMLGLLEHDVLSSIEVPYMDSPSTPTTEQTAEDKPNAVVTKAEADKFDLDTFGLTFNYDTVTITHPENGAAAIPSRPNAEKRASHRHSTVGRIDTIEESPKLHIHKELPPEGPQVTEKSVLPSPQRPSSPSQSSIHSTRSEQSISSKTPSRSGSVSKGSLAKLVTPSWLFNPFRSQPSEPQTTQVSASASPSKPSEKSQKSLARAATPSSPIRMPPPSKPTVAATTNQSIQPMAIKNKPMTRSSLSRTLEDDNTPIPLRSSFIRRSPINTPPRDEILAGKRRSGTSTLAHSFPYSSSPRAVINPTRPQASVSYPQASLARRWQHIHPQPAYKHDLKWKSIVTPGCLPLTVEHFPSSAELESSYDVFSYEFLVDPAEMRSFLVKPPIVRGTAEDLRRAWALVVMRGMAAVRLAQGFQFILRPQKTKGEEDKTTFRRTKSFTGDEELDSWPSGAAEVLSSTTDPVYLSMTNEIHRISYTGEAIQVRRYVRRAAPYRPYSYQCLIWPKLGGA
jgi:hypothetical protein